MWWGYHGFAVIGSGAFKPGQVERVPPIVHDEVVHQLFNPACELPAMVQRGVVARRDEEGNPGIFSSAEHGVDILDRVVLDYARFYRVPEHALRA